MCGLAESKVGCASVEEKNQKPTQTIINQCKLLWGVLLALLVISRFIDSFSVNLNHNQLVKRALG